MTCIDTNNLFYINIPDNSSFLLSEIFDVIEAFEEFDYLQKLQKTKIRFVWTKIVLIMVELKWNGQYYPN